MTNFLEKYGLAIILILVGTYLVLDTLREEKKYGPGDCNLIRGTLSMPPKIVTDSSKTYIGLQLIEYNDVYEFSDCSYNDKVASAMSKLTVGDSVRLYVSKENRGHIIYSRPYRNYRIMEASIPEVGMLVNFEQINACSHVPKDPRGPFVSGALLLWGILRFARIFRDDRSRSALNKLGDMPAIGDTGSEISLKPDVLTYMLRNSLLPGSLIGLGVGVNHSVSLDDLNYMGLAFLGIGLYLLLFFFSSAQKTRYTIGRLGILVDEPRLLSATQTDAVLFSEIQDVFFRRAVYEIGKDIGTVFIDSGRENSDGYKMYTQLMGIKNYKEIAGLISQRAERANEETEL